MKRRSWLWFVVSAALALLAGLLAIVFLNRQDGGGVAPVPKQQVVVALNPIAANQVIRTDNVALDERDLDQIPSGAAVAPEDVVGGIALRDIAQGEVILMQDILPATEGLGRGENLEDKLAVVLPADDILSQWGAVMPGDRVDVLVTLDVILEKPMYVEDLTTVEEASLYTSFERDQSMDGVSVLTLQNLQVLQIIEEPQVGGEGEAQAQQEQPALPRRALILKIDPQDAVVLKYLRDNGAKIDLALRSPENEALFNVQPVNINYLVLRYGIVLPQPLE